MSQLNELNTVIDEQANDDEISAHQHEEIAKIQYEKLNLKQKDIIDKVLNVFMPNKSSTSCFYIDGPGGSGRTFIYTTLYNLLRIKNKTIYTIAFT